MTRLSLRFALVLGLFAAMSANAASISSGDILIYRVGDGGSALTSAATPVFIDEYKPDGSFVQTISVPIVTGGANHRLTASGTATSEGFITQSTNGLYFVFAGYDAAVGTAGVTTSASTAVNRVIGRLDLTGSLDTSTALTDAISGGNPRGAASTDGANLWISGTSTGGGIRYAAFGATTSTALTTGGTSNLRATAIYGGQLYISTGSGTHGVATVGSGTPTTGGQTLTNLPGVSNGTTGSPYQFFIADLDAGVAGLDTIYVADDTANQIQKYSLVGATWTANGTIAASGVRGLTGRASGGSVTLFATSGTTLFTLTDSSGYNATISGALTTLASAGTNKAFRGVALLTSTAPTNPTGTGA